MNKSIQTAYRAPLVVSCGDPNGIGPDVFLTAYAKRSELELPPFYVWGRSSLLKNRAQLLGLDIDVLQSTAKETSSVFQDALPVSELTEEFHEEPGQALASNAPGVIRSIENAVKDVFEGHASGLVTAPISKKPLYEAGFEFPGHTEFLASLAKKHINKPVQPVMMLAGPKLRAVPVTIHIPLSLVPTTLTTENILATVRIVHDDLRTRLGIDNPRIAIAGLNPHAGENGAMGREEIEIIVPAIEALKQEGIGVEGPLPADTMFHDQARAKYDVAVCMYHDQALIPAKALGFDDTVNVTLGLPFVRTSPDHGTAFDIAGTGKAKIDSFVAALRLAQQMVKNV